MPVIKDRYVSSSEAARIIGVSVARVNQMLNADPQQLRGERLNGRAWLIERKDAERVAKQKYTTGRPRSKAS